MSPKQQAGSLPSDTLFWTVSPVAELDAAGNVLKRYGPGYIVKNDTTYRVIKDHLGSVRMVVNSQTGEVVQRIDYDAWGNNTYLQNSEEFITVGFAGGLYDKHTGLIRFGARDYDPQAGRWTTKDPILFDGGTSNLYEYVGNDPINLIDPVGTCPTDPFDKINYHTATDQEKVEAIFKYLTSLNEKGENIGDFKSIFDFTNAKGVEAGDYVGQSYFPTASGTVTLDDTKIPVKLFMGFVANDLPTHGSLYTTFDLSNYAINQNPKGSAGESYLFSPSIGPRNYSVLRIRAFNIEDRTTIYNNIYKGF